MIPDNVEKIIMTKEDYDRNVEKLLLDKLKLEQKIDKAIEYIKQCGGMELVNNYSFPTKPIIDKEAKQELLEILGGNNE